MSDSASKNLLEQFRHFTQHAFTEEHIFIEELPGRFFARAESDLAAVVERDDFITPVSQGAKNGLLELHWLAIRFGTRFSRRYYLVAARIEGNIHTQKITCTLYEYRFAGIGKFQRGPLYRQRVLPPVSVSEVVLHYNPTDPTALYYSESIDNGWTGRERRTDPVRVLKSFGQRLGFLPDSPPIPPKGM